eukprot:scaffold325156_cov57-Tisochrysis_lutea.AAC.1
MFVCLRAGCDAAGKGETVRHGWMRGVGGQGDARNEEGRASTRENAVEGRWARFTLNSPRRCCKKWHGNGILTS